MCLNVDICALNQCSSRSKHVTYIVSVNLALTIKNTLGDIEKGWREQILVRGLVLTDKWQCTTFQPGVRPI